jgi:hypothetical protein
MHTFVVIMATHRDCEVFVQVRGHEVILLRATSHDVAVANARMIVRWEHRAAYVRNITTGVTEAIDDASPASAP